MKRLWRAAQRGIAGQLAIATLVVLPVHAMAEDPPAAPPAAAPNVAPPPPPETPPVPPAQVIEAGSVPVTSSGENGTPGTDEYYSPPDEQRLPPPPDEDAPRIDTPGTQLTASPPQAPPVDGQWVYTSQYGWVWMPYSQSYTYVPDDGYP
ncbi:MAG TPA: hypothetical protein VFG30_25635, partial [Polyangiales bacterium]|nr:hypothetical protein [Polyangiales bacterium]